jgi:hypothetical protein
VRQPARRPVAVAAAAVAPLGRGEGGLAEQVLFAHRRLVIGGAAVRKAAFAMSENSSRVSTSSSTPPSPVS